MKQNLLTISRWLLTIAFVITCGNLFAQNNTIRGVVIDEYNQPIPGVSITIQGSTTGAVTGSEGRFTLAANKGQVITVKFIGFATQEVIITDEPNYSIQLKSDTK